MKTKKKPVKAKKETQPTSELQKKVGTIIYGIHEEKIIKGKILSYRVNGDKEAETVYFVCNKVGTKEEYRVNSNFAFTSIPALFKHLKEDFITSQTELEKAAA